MEQGRREENQFLLTDGWTGLEMMERIHIPTLRSISKENKRLIETLQFLDDVLSFGVIDRWMWIGSAIYAFTDESLVNSSLGRIPPEHKDRINRPQIKKIAKYLSHWRKNEVLYEQDTVEDAILLLHDRLFDNAIFFQSFSPE